MAKRATTKAAPVKRRGKAKADNSTEPRIVAGVGTAFSVAARQANADLVRRKEEAMSRAVYEGMEAGDNDEQMRERMRKAAAEVVE